MITNSKLLRYPGSKWLKHEVLLREDKLKSHLPETYPLSRETIEKMLDKHPTVYLKPSLGGGGRGILRVKYSHNRCLLEDQRSGVRPLPRKQLYNYVARRVKGRNYLVQQGIQLIQWNGRPIDFRCLLYKKDGKWTYLGTMGKVAAARYYTTNLCRGGQAVTLQKALKHSLGFTATECERMEHKLKQLCMDTASCLNRFFPNITQLGLDIAVDQQRRLWILEANTKPRYELYRSHEDRSLYARIDRDIRQLRARK